MWYNRFKEGRDNVNGYDRVGKHNENIEVLKKMNWKLLERLLMMLPYRSAHAKLFLRKRAAVNIVPKWINCEQKQSHI